MNSGHKPRQHNLPDFPVYLPAGPLYKRAPRVDEHGKPLSDFMMIIPKLRTGSRYVIEETITGIQRALAQYADTVVFVDLNLKLNVLWVMVRPVPGICRELPCAITREVPEALLVAQPA